MLLEGQTLFHLVVLLLSQSAACVLSTLYLPLYSVTCIVQRMQSVHQSLVLPIVVQLGCVFLILPQQEIILNFLESLIAFILLIRLQLTVLQFDLSLVDFCI